MSTYNFMDLPESPPGGVGEYHEAQARYQRNTNGGRLVLPPPLHLRVEQSDLVTLIKYVPRLPLGFGADVALAIYGTTSITPSMPLSR
jgi:hypothetical protein